VAGRPHAPKPYGFGTQTGALREWSEAVERLSSSRNYWLGTVRPDGRPHATPVWAVWVEDALYFDGHPDTRWNRNLAANPELCVHLESADEVLILEGRAESLNTDALLAQKIVEEWQRKYGQFSPDPAGGGINRFRPRTARAFKSNLSDATRWEFGGSS